MLKKFFALLTAFSMTCGLLFPFHYFADTQVHAATHLIPGPAGTIVWANITALKDLKVTAASIGHVSQSVDSSVKIEMNWFDSKNLQCVRLSGNGTYYEIGYGYTGAAINSGVGHFTDTSGFTNDTNWLILEGIPLYYSAGSGTQADPYVVLGL